MSPDDFRPREVLDLLLKHQVEFVVIGGLAAQVHGTAMVTLDTDICYRRSKENHQRLAGALVEMHAKLRGVKEDVPFILDGRTIEMGDHFTFVTDYGAFDCMATPKASGGYEVLITTARRGFVDGVEVWIASLDDLIRMKTAAGRPKDLVAVENLVALRDELEGIPDDWEWKSGSDEST